MRKAFLFILLVAMVAAPGCCVLNLHSPISPLAFVNSSTTRKNSVPPEKSARTLDADNSDSGGSPRF